MFNNSAIDVAIGLIFLFALYSLIVTTLTEIVASLLKQRGQILKAGIKRMLDNEDKEDELTISKDGHLGYNLSNDFFKMPEIKYLGKRDFRNKERFPSYLKSKTFVNSFLKSLGFIYSSTKNLQDIREKLNPANETHRIIINMIDEADNNIERFKLLLEDWYNETMDRVSGWYKRRIQLITFIIGAIFAFALNINSIEIARLLSNNDDARLNMVNAASDYMKNYSDVATNSNLQIDSINFEIQNLIKQTRETKSLVDIPWPKWCPKKGEIHLWQYFVGCFLTTIALSLGSPFWFDLLNKLIKLRSSGTQEKTTNSSPPTKSPVG